MYNKEQRWELRYVSLMNGEEKCCYPRSEEKKNEQIALCKEKGITVISCKKLYPFSTEKNQHNFELIHNICMNRINDMYIGEAEWDDDEIKRLEELKEKSEEFFCLPLPIAWLPWEKHCEARELANMAIMHRQDACIRNGRPDLVTYC